MSAVESAAMEAIESDADQEAAGAVEAGEQIRDRQNESADPDPSADRGVMARLFEPMQGSVKQDHIGELWNPGEGGANRLAMVAEEAAGIGDSLPRIAHVPLGIAELYVARAEHVELGGLLGGNDEEEELEHDRQKMGGDTAEVAAFEP